MECYICTKSKQAVVLQIGHLFSSNIINGVDDYAFYPVCNEHKISTVGRPDESDVSRVLYQGEISSPRGDLHMVLNFIKEYFRDKPLPGMDKITPYGIDWLENERLSALIRIVRGFQVAQLELDHFIENNGPD